MVRIIDEDSSDISVTYDNIDPATTPLIINGRVIWAKVLNLLAPSEYEASSSEIGRDWRVDVADLNV